MKKILCGLACLVFAAQFSLWGYDQSPYYLQVVPEAIRAAATGGGTWVTEIQITMIGSGTAVQAKIVNGNYGKTLPALSYASAANSIAVTRPMFIQDLAQDLTYRTSVGIFNGSPVTTYTLRFTIVNANNVQVGAYFQKTIGPQGFMSFNPFAEAGVPSGLYNNCWLAISAITGDSAVPGVFCYASGANNYTNDTYALIARPRN